VILALLGYLNSKKILLTMLPQGGTVLLSFSLKTTMVFLLTYGPLAALWLN